MLAQIYLAKFFEQKYHLSVLVFLFSKLRKNMKKKSINDRFFHSYYILYVQPRKHATFSYSHETLVQADSNEPHNCFMIINYKLLFTCLYLVFLLLVSYILNILIYFKFIKENTLKNFLLNLLFFQYVFLHHTLASIQL